MHIEEFALGDSLIHRLDPRVKVIVGACFCVVTAVAHRWPALLCALLFSVCTILLAHLSPKKVLARLVLVNSFVLFLWLFLPFTFPGRELFSLGPLKASREGVLYATAITLKCNSIVLASIALFSTCSVFNLVHALSHLGVPDKLVHLFFFCFRYIHVIHEEYLRLLQAMKVRCFRPGTNLHTYKTYAYLVGMLLIKSYDRSERIYQAMLCRGFKGKFHILEHFHIKKSDLLWAGAMLGYVGLLAVLEWGTATA